jgi:hypothetical protein
MNISFRSEAGTSLVETVVAIGVLTVGALGMAGVLSQGMRLMTGSPGDLVATQKAAEAIESVFSARDSHIITWAQIRNVNQGGVFLVGGKPLKLAGVDGLINTADDGVIESVTYPGKDGLPGGGDDVVETLDRYSREIKITDLSVDLRSITVTVTYQSGTSTRTYVLTTYISNYA